MSILDHPRWNDLRSCFRIEVYGRDGGLHPRYRIEVSPNTMSLTELTAIRMRCVQCDTPINPIRGRKERGRRRGQSGHLYYTPTCPQTVSLSCSRGQAARDEYVRVRQALMENGQEAALTTPAFDFWV